MRGKFCIYTASQNELLSIFCVCWEGVPRQLGCRCLAFLLLVASLFIGWQTHTFVYSISSLSQSRRFVFFRARLKLILTDSENNLDGWIGAAAVVAVVVVGGGDEKETASHYFIWSTALSPFEPKTLSSSAFNWNTQVTILSWLKWTFDYFCTFLFYYKCQRTVKTSHNVLLKCNEPTLRNCSICLYGLKSNFSKWT